MVRRFEIEYPDNCGKEWLNKDNLLACLRTPTFIGNMVGIVVDDITDVSLPVKYRTAIEPLPESDPDDLGKDGIVS